MITNRLQLALERLKPSDWHNFEKLASAFLAFEFDDLRTTASPSGDDGRDSELFSPAGDPSVLLQYSVRRDWGRKIRQTLKRIQKTFPCAHVLVFASNQEIGASGDSLKREARKKYAVSLDLRDRNWFVERVLGSAPREKAAEELSCAIVDPYLAAAGVTSYAPSDLSSPEAIAAVTFLGLQWRDDLREKGLTKLAFEALVRAVLLDTDSANRMSRDSIREGVSKLLRGHPKEQVHRLTDSALKRLTKRAIRHWQKEDGFCLTHEEKLRVNDFKVEASLAEGKLLSAIRSMSAAILDPHPEVTGKEAAFTECIRSATEAVLLERSQSFAMSVQTGTSMTLLDTESSSAPLAKIIADSSLQKTRGIAWLDLLRSGVQDVLLSDKPEVQVYLRSLADAYTLMAFLRQTPDVQGAVEKMFSHGRIWLDTSVVLPLLAEPLIESEPGRFTKMIQAARDVGLQLFVTSGVIEEIERHMNRARTCLQVGEQGWVGAVPYLLKQYVSSGRPQAAFGKWLENFCGHARPEQDISEFLHDEFDIATRGLKEESEAVGSELRHALQGIWYSMQQNRRDKFNLPHDDVALTRLVEHDVECYCGVTQLRRKERASPFGYSAWWLTIDRKAFNLKDRLRNTMNAEPPDSPVLSADFMVNYLAFGPLRRRVGKAKEAHLPLTMELGTARYLTPELLHEAEKLREELRDLPERVVRRRIRDHLDRARRRVGSIARSGLDELDDEIEQ